jgi:hypothetical protein
MDFQVNGVSYKAGKLPAMRQFHIVRRCAPLLAGIADKDKALESIFNGIGNLSDEDADYILFGLLSCVQRDRSPHGWANVSTGSSLMFDDIDLGAMLQISAKAFSENFSSFLDAIPSDLIVTK